MLHVTRVTGGLPRDYIIGHVTCHVDGYMRSYMITWESSVQTK